METLATFGTVLINEPERRYFGEYLTGLLIAQRKPVRDMTAEFAESADQSCLKRWLTEVSWDPKELNRQRLAWLQTQYGTRYSRFGIIAIDNTLVDHSGKLIENVGYFWDHAEDRYKLAQDYLIANYVCSPSGLHYPLDFRRYRKREEYEAGEADQTHDMLFRELVAWAVKSRKILLTNKVQWEAHRTIEVYRKRWTGTETFHRDGKQQLGLGDCQLRGGEGQNRHLYLVMTAYSLLMAKLKQGGARKWGHQLIRTIGEACRDILREILGKLALA